MEKKDNFAAELSVEKVITMVKELGKRQKRMLVCEDQGTDGDGQSSNESWDSVRKSAEIERQCVNYVEKQRSCMKPEH